MKRSPLIGVNPRTLALFVIVVGPPAVSLVWLGAQLMLQNQSLANQRDTE